MSTEEPKSRVVVFRLTEREYALLKLACRRERRSVSGFARSELLSRLRKAPRKKEMPEGLEEQLARLETSLETLKELIECKLSEGRNQPE